MVALISQMARKLTLQVTSRLLILRYSSLRAYLSELNATSYRTGL